MSDTEPKRDFGMFRTTLTKFERLIGVWNISYFVADPVCASQKQETPFYTLPSECKKPKTIESVSCSSSLLEDQDNIHMHWLQNQNKVNEEWIHKQIEAQTKCGIDSRLKNENKVHMRLTQDQNKVNMEWLQHQNAASMIWIRDQNEARMKWHQKQNEVHTTKDDVDSSEEDEEELTPSSIMTSA